MLPLYLYLDQFILILQSFGPCNDLNSIHEVPRSINQGSIWGKWVFVGIVGFLDDGCLREERLVFYLVYNILINISSPHDIH